jgi:hypothetical protein
MGARALTLIDPAGKAVGTLVTDGDGTYKLRPIATTTTVAPTMPAPFTFNLSRALTPMQMGGVYQRELDRVFHVDHSS